MILRAAPVQEIIAVAVIELFALKCHRQGVVEEFDEIRRASLLYDMAIWLQYLRSTA
jgi:hypothetical protein